MLNIVEELQKNGLSQEHADKITKEWGLFAKEKNERIKALEGENTNLTKSFEGSEKARVAAESQIEDIDKKIAKAHDEGKSELVETLQEERKKAEELSGELAEMGKLNMTLKIDASIRNELSGLHLKTPKSTYKAIRSDVSVNDAGDILYEGVPISEGISEFFKTTEGMQVLDPQGEAGTGTNNSGGSGNTVKGNMGGSRDERLSAINNMMEK